MAPSVGKYGPRVIGEKKAAEERDAVKKNLNKYGPRVLGETPIREHGPKVVKEAGSKKAQKETAEVPPQHKRAVPKPPDGAGEVVETDGTGAVEQGPELVLEGGRAPAPDGLEFEPEATEATGTGEDTADEGATEPETGDGEGEQGDEAQDGEEGEQEPATPGEVEAAGADSYLSVDELKAYVEENPGEADRMLAAEFARPGGPRKTALRHFLALEEAKEEPRQAFVDSINERL